MTRHTITNGLNDAHIIEALDRLHVACVYIDEFLGQHPILNIVPEFINEIEKATDILGGLYQKVGGFESMGELAKKYNLNNVT